MIELKIFTFEGSNGTFLIRSHIMKKEKFEDLPIGSCLVVIPCFPQITVSVIYEKTDIDKLIVLWSNDEEWTKQKLSFVYTKIIPELEVCRIPEELVETVKQYHYRLFMKQPNKKFFEWVG